MSKKRLNLTLSISVSEIYIKAYYTYNHSWNLQFGRKDVIKVLYVKWKDFDQIFDSYFDLIYIESQLFKITQIIKKISNFKINLNDS